MAHGRALGVEQIVDDHFHGLAVGHMVDDRILPTAQAFNAAVGRVAEIALAGRAMPAQNLGGRGLAHGFERRRVAEGPVHVQIRDGHGVGHAVENAFVPVGLVAQLAYHVPQGFGQVTQAVRAVKFQFRLFAPADGVGIGHQGVNGTEPTMDEHAAHNRDERDERQAVQQAFTRGTRNQLGGLQALLEMQHFMEGLSNQGVTDDQQPGPGQEHGDDKRNNNFGAEPQTHETSLASAVPEAKAA